MTISSPTTASSTGRVEPFTAVRRVDWEIRFTHFMHESKQLQSDLILDWEHITCTSWVGQGIEEITGMNPYEPFDGLHKSIAQACRTIRQSGFSNLDDLIAALFGHGEIPIAYATRGDLVLAPIVEGWCSEPQQDGPDDLVSASDATLVMPHGVALADPPFYWAVTPQGLGKGPLSTAHRVFAIGRDVSAVRGVFK